MLKAETLLPSRATQFRLELVNRTPNEKIFNFTVGLDNGSGRESRIRDENNNQAFILNEQYCNLYNSGITKSRNHRQLSFASKL